MAFTKYTVQNNLPTSVLFNMGCASATDNWYKTQELEAGAGSVDPGSSNYTMNAPCSGTNPPWLACQLWKGSAAVGDFPDAYVVVDGTTGKVQDASIDSSWASYHVSPLTGGVVTVTLCSPSSPCPPPSAQRHWWVLFLVLLLAVAGVVAFVLIRRRRAGGK